MEKPLLVDLSVYRRGWKVAACVLFTLVPFIGGALLLLFAERGGDWNDPQDRKIGLLLLCAAIFLISFSIGWGIGFCSWWTSLVLAAEKQKRASGKGGE